MNVVARSREKYSVQGRFHKDGRTGYFQPIGVDVHFAGGSVTSQYCEGHQGGNELVIRQRPLNLKTAWVP